MTTVKVFIDGTLMGERRFHRYKAALNKEKDWLVQYSSFQNVIVTVEPRRPHDYNKQ